MWSSINVHYSGSHWASVLVDLSKHLVKPGLYFISIPNGWPCSNCAFVWAACVLTITNTTFVFAKIKKCRTWKILYKIDFIIVFTYFFSVLHYFLKLRSLQNMFQPIVMPMNEPQSWPKTAKPNNKVVLSASGLPKFGFVHCL